MKEVVLSDDELQIKLYSDSITAYLYRSKPIVEGFIDKCDSIMAGNPSISSDMSIFFYNRKINYFLIYNQPLKAYQLIVDHEQKAQESEVSEDNKNRFSYFNAYTLLILGDLDEAQKIFYRDLEKAKEKKDTFTVTSSLYSLGQLYGDKDDYHAAIKCYQEVVEIKDHTNVIPETTIALIDYELGNNYYDLKDYDKAQQVTERGLAYAKENKVDLLIPYFLDREAKIALARKQNEIAEKLAIEVHELAVANGDQRTLKLSRNLQAKVYKKSGRYQQAINIFTEELATTDSIQYNERLKIYKHLHELYNLIGQPTEAYSHLQLHNAIKAEKDLADNKEKTAYLKIKFETEQQKAANQLLASEVKQGQDERKLLYLISILFFLGMIGLFAAFYQKKKYNKTLKQEVEKRTDELRQTNLKLTKRNSELDEFNRILAHDLREPLRSIVGFSQMAKASNTKNTEVEEYLSFVEKGGRQLHEIINGIATYRDVVQNATEPELVDTANLVDQIKTTIQPNYPDRNIQISSQSVLPEILVQPKVLKTVFEQLIDNGIKYNENETAVLAIQYSKNKETHVFDFTDNGIGIAPQYHQKIFDMCKRLHSRIVYEGSGLGLNITQKILENNSGQIRLVASSEGEGSTFRVELPFV